MINSSSYIGSAGMLMPLKDIKTLLKINNKVILKKLLSCINHQFK